MGQMKSHEPPSDGISKVEPNVTEHANELASPERLTAEFEQAVRVLIGVWWRSDEALGRVSLGQLRALETLGGPDTLNLRMLADRLGMISSSASRLCGRLQAAGLLDRAKSDQDRRQIALRLTQTGKRLLRDLSAHRRRDLDEILTRMTPNGRAALLHGLQEFTTAAAGPPRTDGHTNEHAR